MLLLLLKYWLLSAGIAMFAIAAGILAYDSCLLIAEWRRRCNSGPEAGTSGLAPRVDADVGAGVAAEVDAEVSVNARWRTSVAFGLLAWAPLVILASMLIASGASSGKQVNRSETTVAGTMTARDTSVTR
jgi:hypothetical protein